MSFEHFDWLFNQYMRHYLLCSSRFSSLKKLSFDILTCMYVVCFLDEIVLKQLFTSVGELMDINLGKYSPLFSSTKNNRIIVN